MARSLLSKFGKKSYTEIPADTELVVFGQETKGLPKWVHEKYKDDLYSIPMFHSGVRSLNLSNTVALVTP